MKRISALLFVATLLCFNLSAQKEVSGTELTWTPVFTPAHVMKVVYYGAYQAGKEVSRFSPSKDAEEERFFFGEYEGETVVIHTGSPEGTKVYAAKLNGDMVYMSNVENTADVTSLRLEYAKLGKKEGNVYLYTVDKAGTYRYLESCTPEELELDK
ncbi:MAG: hypothetical protein IJ722_05720 [Alloprevotella sp.]|nr:hypothetical protein [Alloprevotella sp.]